MDEVGRKRSRFFAKMSMAMGKKGDHRPDEVLEEEIRSLVDEGEEQGYIEQQEREMIHNIFDFDEQTAGDLMTHRTEVVAANLEDKISEVLYLAIDHGFSRIPVYDGVIDNIKGVIYAKDLLCLVGCQSYDDFKISDFIRKVIYIPEAMKGDDLFRLLKKEKIHLAIVVDEWGGTAGIVTMEDLLESIVGNIQDEYDDEEEIVTEIDADNFLFDGNAHLDEVQKLLGVTLEADEDTDTLGGFVTEMLGYIPDDDQTPTVDVGGYRFSVLEMDERRVAKVQAMRLPAEE